MPIHHKEGNPITTQAHLLEQSAPRRCDSSAMRRAFCWLSGVSVVLCLAACGGGSSFSSGGTGSSGSSSANSSFQLFQRWQQRLE
jgi:hypothetical protein